MLDRVPKVITNGWAPAADSSSVAHDRLGPLRSLVGRSELFAQNAQWHVLDAKAIEGATTVWFGLGVAQQRPNRGLPLDVLVLVLALESVRRALEVDQGVILVADSNAEAAGLDAGAVARSAKEASVMLTAAVSLLGLPVRIRAASSIPQSERVEVASPAASKTAPNPYVEEQLRQMEWMRRAGGSVKVGWALSSASWDERAFDDIFRSRLGMPLCSVYTLGGRTLESRRPRACPYLCNEPERRLLLAPDEDIRGKLAGAPESAARGYQRLVAKISRGVAQTLGERPPRDPVGHIDALLRALGDRHMRDER